MENCIESCIVDYTEECIGYCTEDETESCTEDGEGTVHDAFSRKTTKYSGTFWAVD